MSSWAPKLAENAAKARDRCIEHLNGLARQVGCALDDMKGRDWIFDLDTHPYDRIDAAMTWAEGLVRRVILARVVQLRGSYTAGSSAGRNPSHALSKGAGVDDTAWTPDGSGVVGERGDIGAHSPETRSTVIPGAAQHQDDALLNRDQEAARSRVCTAPLSRCSAHGMTIEYDDEPFKHPYHKPYSPPEPNFKYRPTFRWTEARSVPGVPSGQPSMPRQKPRKYDMRTKVEAKLALYRHMLENADAYAKRLAHRLETRSPVIPAGEPGPSREDDRTSSHGDAGSSPASRLSSTVSPGEDPGHPEAFPKPPPPQPILSWQLYSTPPPGGDDLRTDLIALHMAYETTLSAFHAGQSSAETNKEALSATHREAEGAAGGQ